MELNSYVQAGTSRMNRIIALPDPSAASRSFVKLEHVLPIVRVEEQPQPSHRLRGFPAKRALASGWHRATRHGYENKMPKTEANEV
jgi:hypothetical protein